MKKFFCPEISSTLNADQFMDIYSEFKLNDYVIKRYSDGYYAMKDIHDPSAEVVKYFV